MKRCAWRLRRSTPRRLLSRPRPKVLDGVYKARDRRPISWLPRALPSRLPPKTFAQTILHTSERQASKNWSYRCGHSAVSASPIGRLSLQRRVRPAAARSRDYQKPQPTTECSKGTLLQNRVFGALRRISIVNVGICICGTSVPVRPADGSRIAGPTSSSINGSRRTGSTTSVRHARNATAIASSLGYVNMRGVRTSVFERASLVFDADAPGRVFPSFPKRTCSCRHRRGCCRARTPARSAYAKGLGRPVAIATPEIFVS